jgi:hypothetical protein
VILSVENTETGEDKRESIPMLAITHAVFVRDASVAILSDPSSDNILVMYLGNRPPVRTR